MPEVLRVLFVTSELSPYSKTGGLADVSAALPKALSAHGCDVRVISPLYGFIDAEKFGIDSVGKNGHLDLRIGEHSLRAKLKSAAGSDEQLAHTFVDCDALYDRPGIYLDPFTGRDYIDNDYRFVLLTRAAIAMCADSDWIPHIVHCNDWQCGMLPALLNRMRADDPRWSSTRSVFTIHNMAYQGWFPPDTLGRIGHVGHYFYPGGPLEFHGLVNFLKAGVSFADAVNTVSPTYALEIQSGYEYGFGLEGVLGHRPNRVRGILNGIDADIWNPQTDKFIAETYSDGALLGKSKCKERLCQKAGFHYDKNVPLFAMISRIAGQKGFEILAPAIPDILNVPAQFVLLGSGDPYYEHMFHEYARLYPDRFAVKLAYDETLAHEIEAGADFFLMPSKYEPCGLNQMMSMRYGTIPIVRSTGGLADTVIDADEDFERGTGFRFHDYHSGALMWAVGRAIHAYKNPERITHIRRNGMTQDFSWERSAMQYIELYKESLERQPLYSE